MYSAWSICLSIKSATSAREIHVPTLPSPTWPALTFPDLGSLLSIVKRRIVQSRSELRTVSAALTMSSYAPCIVVFTRLTIALVRRVGLSFGSLALRVEVMISLRTPCFFMAAIMFCIPCDIGLFFEPPRGPNVLSTASVPFIAFSINA